MDVLAQIRLLALCLLITLCTACTTTFSPCTCNNTMTDTDITELVQNRIRGDKALYFQDIHVRTFERTVFLRGTVENPTQADAAALLARTTPNVKCVVSSIKLRCCVKHTEFIGHHTATKECGS